MVVSFFLDEYRMGYALNLCFRDSGFGIRDRICV